MKTISCFLISDFNLSNLSALLANCGEFKFSIETSPYNQSQQLLMNGSSFQAGGVLSDIALIWTQPQAALPSFPKVLSYQKFALQEILNEVDTFCDLLKRRAVKAKYYLIPTWVSENYRRGYGFMDLKNPNGLANIMNEINDRLINNLRGEKDFFILDANQWMVSCGKKSFNPKMWYMAKTPFEGQVYKETVSEIVRFCHAIKGNSKKLVVVDLDDVLWGGILGDAGSEGINLGGHDPIGEAFVDFQKELRSLTRRGILLAIVSKNDETRALETIENHPEMILRKSDFSGWRINWEDKAENIAELAEELNLGLQSTVFIDDNPVERARIRDVFPEVYVPEWPQDKMLYASTLLGLSCFDTLFISQEDQNRTEMYTAERERKSSKLSLGSYEDWLHTLEIKVQAEVLDAHNIQRAAQLLNKTNQMNLTTCRLTEAELKKWAQKRNHWTWVIRVSDKFGDSGLTGILSLNADGEKGRIVDFVLSCRVMGRKIEETMAHILWYYARELNLSKLCAEFFPTPKNKPCLEFWKNSGFANPETHQFTWNVKDEYKLPSCIHLDKPSFCHGSKNEQFV